MEPKKCEYSKCGTEFTPNDGKQRFCCDNHRWAANREKKKENLGSVENTQTRTPSLFQAPRPQMDSMTAYLFHKMEGDLKEAKDEIRDKNKLIDKAKEDKDKLTSDYQAKEREFEKKINEMSNTIDAKPTGLNGIMQTSGFEKLIEGLAPHIGPKLAGLLDKMNTPTSPHADEITRWMLTLPEQMRHNFLMMLQAFMQLPPDKINEKMSEVARGLMGVTSQEQLPVIEKKKISFDYN